MVPDLLELAIEYADAVVAVGCAEHADPTCLCDVIVTDPVPIRYPLGSDRSAVLFSATVNAEFPVEECLETHLIVLAALYEAAAPGIVNAREKIFQQERLLTERSTKHFHPTPEQEYWLRRDIPHDWCAWNIDVPPGTVQAWRKRHGVVISERMTDFQRSNANFSSRVQHEPTYKLDVGDPATLSILLDADLSHAEVSEMLNVSQSCVRASRRRIGYSRKGISRGSKHKSQCAVDWDSPDVQAVLDDASLSLSKAAEALGVTDATICRRRQARRKEMGNV
jgi:hypothetical protein